MGDKGRMAAFQAALLITGSHRACRLSTMAFFIFTTILWFRPSLNIRAWDIGPAGSLIIDGLHLERLSLISDEND
jgi:hypothetical protein